MSNSIQDDQYPQRSQSTAERSSPTLQEAVGGRCCMDRHGEQVV